MAGSPPRNRSYRVLDNNTGAIVIADLPHLTSAGNVRAPQAGLAGSATLGDIRLLLPPVRSKEWLRDRALYDLLAVGQRIEGFLGDSPTGTPATSHILTKTPRRNLTGPVELVGMDTLWQLQQTQLYPGEQLGAGAAMKVLFDIARGARKLVWDDDFANWSGSGAPPPNSSNYSGSGWSFQAADPQYGQPCVKATTTGALAVSAPGGALLTSSWAANAQYNWPTLPAVACTSMVTAKGTLVAGTDTTQAASAEVVFLSDATFANAFMGRITSRQTAGGSGLYNINAEIWQVVGGVSTLEASATNVLTNVPAQLGFELAVVISNIGTSHTAHLWLNGKDTGCSWSFAGTPANTSGGVGIRTTWNAGGSPACYVNSLRFSSRTGNWGARRFLAGTTATGVTLPQTITSSGQTHLDLALLASTTDVLTIRKTAGYGFESDVLDYTASPGQDLSGRVLFVEGDGGNVVDCELGPVADMFSTASRVNAVPGGDSGGSITFSPRGNGGDIEFTDTVADMGAMGATLLTAYAIAVGKRKAAPAQAVQLVVRRTADTADVWRELDTVMVNVPSHNLNMVKLQVMGYTWDEASDVQTVWLTQFPERAFPQGPLHRITRPLEWLTRGG